MARIGLRRVQARQRRSIRSLCMIVMFFFYNFLTGTFRSFPLERFQAPREKESFVIDSVFIPITDSQTQEADAVQLRLAYGVSLGTVWVSFSHLINIAENLPVGMHIHTYCIV